MSDQYYYPSTNKLESSEAREPESYNLSGFNDKLTIQDTKVMILVGCRGMKMAVRKDGSNVVVTNLTEGRERVVEPTYGVQISRSNDWFSKSGFRDFPLIENEAGRIVISNCCRDGSTFVDVEPVVEVPMPEHVPVSESTQQRREDTLTEVQNAIKGIELEIGESIALARGEVAECVNPAVIRVKIGYGENNQHNLTLNYLKDDEEGNEMYIVTIEDPDIQPEKDWHLLSEPGAMFIGRDVENQIKYWFANSDWVSHRQLELIVRDGHVLIKRDGQAPTSVEFVE